MKRTAKKLPSHDDLRIMVAALAAWNGERVTLTAEEWERAEKLLEETF